ncbi:hypothetical protein PPL_08807 [Heterostelium album PN500]|uniref:Uncharacterized protein n=1 Tax=Heterostelium pallidum (strain ATCC 26659 / Pp 5 / PN500) TaxID=670386 RepID=D3BJS7_HETP5|nr:hypothetical protein PPL_08807 [Heterostelium album PN500]EFA78157.1 hypothetical protein PPL_08807 [Heterostelium album PN500]|eukprot:XP_020430283.1 hypothetical protein PPL_08807 [Heterostelium album PN500]
MKQEVVKAIVLISLISSSSLVDQTVQNEVKITNSNIINPFDVNTRAGRRKHTKLTRENPKITQKFKCHHR